MRHDYCTVFDSNYLAKGIAMIHSLLKHSHFKPTIYVLYIDDECEDTMDGLKIHEVIGVTMEQFDATTGIVNACKGRTHQERCWTYGSVFAQFVMEQEKIESLTYIDADCFFFSDPEVVFDEIGDKSIGITPHRFAKADEARLLPNGKYAVQWVTFKGEVGRKCLSKWSGQVREWCFYRHEDGKFGDQKYLDTWVTDYPGEVCEIENIGVGTAPWNVAQYQILDGAGGRPVLIHEGYGIPLIMYHFHEFLHGQRLTNWNLPHGARQCIYAPYIKAIEEAQALINETVHLQA